LRLERHLTKAGDRVDWDWEDGPPRDAPRDASREGPRPDDAGLRDDPQPPSASETASFADAVERFGGSSQPAFDEERTQVIRPSRSLEGRPGGDVEAAKEGELPGGERSHPAATGEELPRHAGRPPTQAARAAARARRRRQVRRRRLVALAVVVLVAALCVVLLVRGCGGSTGGQASAGPPPSAALPAGEVLIAAGPALPTEDAEWQRAADEAPAPGRTCGKPMVGSWRQA
jgi:hypothetical protein